MAMTVEDLEKRLAALEEEVARLRLLLEQRIANETSAERGARLLREARESQPALNAITAEVFAKMGITGEPVGHERLMEMMLECGIDPNDNAFSREIQAMREE